MQAQGVLLEKHLIPEDLKEFFEPANCGQCYICHLTEIFNEVKRVLKKEGTLWIVIGDTYGGSCQGGGDTGLSKERYRKELLTYTDKPQKKLMPKCLMMIPERLALSLVDIGFILRNKNIWHKPNPMPSSVKDRFSNTWEYLFMFSKSQRYYFDLDAVREPHKEESFDRYKYPFNAFGGGMESGQISRNNPTKRIELTKHDKAVGRTGNVSYTDPLYTKEYHPEGKNPGDVIETPSETRTLGAILGTGKAAKVPGGKGWTGHPEGGGAACQKDPRWCPPEGKNPGDFFDICTQPFPEAHFAVFPEGLCIKPIKAGCPEEVCKKCGKARERITERKAGFNEDGNCFQCGESKNKHHQGKKSMMKSMDKNGLIPCGLDKTIGFTSCDCKAGFEPGIVLDPFCGAGTVGVVAKKLNRRFIGIEIKSEYVNMSRKRIQGTGCQLELKI